MLKKLLVALGAAALLRPILGGAGAILVLHRVRPRDPSLAMTANHRNSVPAELLGALLDALHEDGVAVVTIDDALSRLSASRKERFVCLTFDDGYRDNLDTLLPMLEARRIPATIYVTPGLLDGSAPLWWYGLDEAIQRESRMVLPLPLDTQLACADALAKEAAFSKVAGVMLGASRSTAAAVTDALARRYGVDFAALASRHMMDWQALRQLAASPFVEIGAHTMSHPALAMLEPDEAAAELAESRQRLEAETGRRVRHLAYPYGVPGTTGAREFALAARLDFRSAVTTIPGSLTSAHAASPFALPRHGIGPMDGPAALRLKLAGLTNPFRRARADR